VVERSRKETFFNPPFYTSNVYAVSGSNFGFPKKKRIHLECLHRVRMSRQWKTQSQAEVTRKGLHEIAIFRANHWDISPKAEDGLFVCSRQVNVVFPFWPTLVQPTLCTLVSPRP
jgi:hypothetical protein